MRKLPYFCCKNSAFICHCYSVHFHSPQPSVFCSFSPSISLSCFTPIVFCGSGEICSRNHWRLWLDRMARVICDTYTALSTCYRCTCVQSRSHRLPLKWSAVRSFIGTVVLEDTAQLWQHKKRKEKKEENAMKYYLNIKKYCYIYIYIYNICFFLSPH